MRHLIELAVLGVLVGVLTNTLSNREPEFKVDEVGHLITTIEEHERLERHQARAEFIFDQAFEIKP